MGYKDRKVFRISVHGHENRIKKCSRSYEKLPTGSIFGLFCSRSYII